MGVNKWPDDTVDGTCDVKNHKNTGVSYLSTSGFLAINCMFSKGKTWVSDQFFVLHTTQEAETRGDALGLTNGRHQQER